jgi:hypothetical protein
MLLLVCDHVAIIQVLLLEREILSQLGLLADRYKLKVDVRLDWLSATAAVV